MNGSQKYYVIQDQLPHFMILAIKLHQTKLTVENAIKIIKLGG
jgi:hypothetical protein